ncbi:hypothetical protein ACP70R_000792 [Stipagrostis hirtigluma subsp. patula]
MTRRRRLPSSAAPAPAAPLEDDDILSEILLRLPPRPSSLPRASLVCKRWRRLVSDPHFLRRFRGHHRKAPLLGFFYRDVELNIVFTSALDSPERIPDDRFFLRLENAIDCETFGCRHGHVLVLNMKQRYFLVWDPVTGDQRRVDFPPAFRGKAGKHVTNGAVVCAAGEHGGYHSSPFQVVLLARNWERIFACVYSSGTSAWGNVISLLWPHDTQGVSADCPNVLVGNSIFWLLNGRSFGILEFDLSMQRLAAIEIPSNVVDVDTWIHSNCQFLITPADDGGLNFLVLTGFNARVWKRKANCNGGAGWVLQNAFDLNGLLLLKAGADTRPPDILGLAEDDNAMFLLTDVGVFMVHHESMKFKKLSDSMGLSHYDTHHPFTSFYSGGHVAEGMHRLSTHNTSQATETTCMIRSERAASGMGRHAKNVVLQSQKRRASSMEGEYRSPDGAPLAEFDTEHVGLSNEGDYCENLVPHMFESEVPTSIAGVKGAHIERFGSKRPVENGNSSFSSIPPTQGATEIKNIVVETMEAYMELRKKQNEPQREFSVAMCINTMREMVDVSDEEKVLSCDLFRDAVNREIFLSLDVTLRTMWLKKQLTKFH